MKKPEKLLTTAALADRYGKTQGAIRAWRNRGCGPKWRRLNDGSPRGRVVYAEKDVLAWERATGTWIGDHP